MSFPCPQCDCTENISSRRGYSRASGVAGWMVFGPAGLLFGFWGAHRIMLTCSACGDQWEKHPEKRMPPLLSGLCIALIIVAGIVSLYFAFQNIRAFYGRWSAGT